jgi:hypothetical protein
MAQVRAVQPFHDGPKGPPHPIALLDYANNVNKHRVISPYATLGVRFAPRLTFNRRSTGTEQLMAQIAADTRLTDGALLGRFIVDPTTTTSTSQASGRSRLKNYSSASISAAMETREARKTAVLVRPAHHRPVRTILRRLMATQLPTATRHQGSARPAEYTVISSREHAVSRGTGTSDRDGHHPGVSGYRD